MFLPVTIAYAVLWPGVVLFAALIAPLGLLQLWAAQLVNLLDKRVKISGVSVMLLIAWFGFLTFSYDLYEWHRDYYLKHHEHTDMFKKMEYNGHKWRAERDLYMSALTFVLYASLRTIAKVRLHLHEVKTEVKKTDDKKTQ